METTTTTTRRNRYAAPCFECGGTVPATTGQLELWEGKWLVRHNACADRAAVIDAAIESRRAPVCSRHGNEYDAKFASADGCWECHMDAAEVARDRAEAIDVAEFKMARDRQAGWS